MGIVGVEERRGDFRTVKLHVWKRGGGGEEPEGRRGKRARVGLAFLIGSPRCAIEARPLYWGNP